MEPEVQKYFPLWDVKTVCQIQDDETVLAEYDTFALCSWIR